LLVIGGGDGREPIREALEELDRVQARAADAAAPAEEEPGPTELEVVAIARTAETKLKLSRGREPSFPEFVTNMLLAVARGVDKLLKEAAKPEG